MDIISNQAPLILFSNQTSSFNNKFYFFPENKNTIQAKFSLEHFGTTLSLNAIDKPFININYPYNNTQDAKGPTVYPASIDCYQIYFRLPGEHTIDGEKYDMELQINCTVKYIVIFIGNL
jgi:hypothetical protein